MVGLKFHRNFEENGGLKEEGCRVLTVKRRTHLLLSPLSWVVKDHCIVIAIYHIAQNTANFKDRPANGGTVRSEHG